MAHPRITFQEIPPRLYELMSNIESYIKECNIEHSLVELIKTRASQINKCGFCLDMHHKDALKAGEKFDRLYLLPAWKESPVYSAEEKAVLNLTDTLTNIAKAEPEEIERAYEYVATYYTKEQIANLVLIISQINTWNRISITFGNIPGTYKA